MEQIDQVLSLLRVAVLDATTRTDNYRRLMDEATANAEMERFNHSRAANERNIALERIEQLEAEIAAMKAKYDPEIKAERAAALAVDLKRIQDEIAKLK